MLFSYDSTTSYAKGIINLFCKTSLDTAREKLWDLKQAYGCQLSCSCRHLPGTMKGRMKPIPLKPKHMLKAIDMASEKITLPGIFNTDHLPNSLMYSDGKDRRQVQEAEETQGYAT